MRTNVFANDRLRLSVTDTCNFRCPYCTNEGQSHNSGTYISVDHVKRLADTITKEDIYIRKLNITGGEPLLHPQLKEIIKICSSICSSVTINTNGELLSKEKILEFHEVGITNIKFGVDSFFQDLTKPSYSRIYSHPNRIIENLNFAVSLMPRSSANIVLTDFNSTETERIIKFIIDNNINWVEFLELINHDFRGLSIMPSPGKKFQEIFSSFSGLFREITYNHQLAKYICHTTTDLVMQFAEDFCARRVCQNLWTRIDSMGRLVPCIKTKTSYEIDFKIPLIDQIEKSNCLMCNGPKGLIPRDYSGNLLLGDQIGPYVAPTEWDNIGSNIKETRFDP